MSLGGETLFVSGKLRGCQLQEPVGTRQDVVHFISQDFEEDRIINGIIKVHLQVSTDVEDTCFTVKICDVFPDGRTFNIRNGMTTLAYRNGAKRRGFYKPEEIVDIDIKCLPILWKIKAGHKLRVDISSSNFPEYAIHSNRPGVWSEIETSVIAHQHIYLGKEEGSRISIPFTKG